MLVNLLHKEDPTNRTEKQSKNTTAENFSDNKEGFMCFEKC